MPAPRLRGRRGVAWLALLLPLAAVAVPLVVLVDVAAGAAGITGPSYAAVLRTTVQALGLGG